MKNTLIIFLLTFASFISNGQDTIRKTDGSTIVCIVKEINEDNIVYTLIDQAEGPIRKISIENVAEITYKNGTKEHFTVLKSAPIENKGQKEKEPEVVVGAPGTINNTDRTVIIPRKGPDISVKPGEVFPGADLVSDKILKTGSYFEGLMGYAYSSKRNNAFLTYNSDVVNKENLTFGVRFGSKFYFGSNDKQRFGINMAWISFTGLLNDYNGFDVLFSPANFGLASVFKFSDHVGLEANTSFGVGISSLYRNAVGIKYGADVKFRYDALAIGIDFARTNGVFGYSNDYANLISLSVGIKF